MPPLAGRKAVIFCFQNQCDQQSLHFWQRYSILMPCSITFMSFQVIELLVWFIDECSNSFDSRSTNNSLDLGLDLIKQISYIFLNATATPYLEQINVNSAIETMEDSTSSLTIFGAAYLRLTFGSPLMSFNSVSYKQDQNHNLQLTWWEKEEKELQAFWTFQDHCWNKQPFMHNLRMNTLILDAQQHIRLTTWKRGNWQLWHRLSNEWWNDLLLSLGDIEHGELGGELVGCHTSHQPWFVWSRRMVTAISSLTSTVTFSAMEILTTTLSSSFCIPTLNVTWLQP